MHGLGDSLDGYRCTKDVDGDPSDSQVVVYQAYNCAGNEGGLRIRDLSTGEESILTPPGSQDYGPRWSPSGDRIAWYSAHSPDIHTIPEGGGTPTTVTPDTPFEDTWLYTLDWADSGFVFGTHVEGAIALWTCKADGTNARPLVADEHRNKHPDWAPGSLPAWSQPTCEAIEGYWASDNLGGFGCWFASAQNESCTDACISHGLQCDPRNWNDFPTCEICTHLTGAPKAGPNNPSYAGCAPYYYYPGGTSHGCYYRSETVDLDCDHSGGDQMRICICSPRSARSQGAS